MTIELSHIGVLATIMPVALLLVGFEVRSFPGLVATGRAGTISLWLFGACLVTALAAGFWAEYRMVLALLDGVAIAGVDVHLVRIGFALVGMVSFWLLTGTLLLKLGVLQRLGTRARSRVTASPRRLYRQVEYVDKHHPNWRDSE